MKKNDKKLINAWSMYDWANSVYALVITSTVFPIYYNEVTGTDQTDIVHFLGIDFKNTALYSFALSLSFLIIALFSPMFSSIADYSGKKKGFMQFFCYMGALACGTLFFFTGNATLGLGIAAFILASIGFSGSIIFYNAYLPEIATPDRQDHVSARGYSMGYIGSVLLLIFNLLMIQKPSLFGITDPQLPARISFLTVGLWWAGFAQVTFFYLPKNVYKRKITSGLLAKGYKELQKVWHQLKDYKHLRLFLLAFFFYMMGVQTVMYMAASFGEKELGLPSGTLITTVLVIQVVAIAGAYFFSWLSGQWGNVKSLMTAVTVWIGISVGAYFITGAAGFITVAAFVGLVMGGIQSLSRSTYSKLLPETKDHASFFSFYEATEKIGIVLGTFSFGMIEELTGSMRNSLFMLTAYFIIGLFLLLWLRAKLLRWKT